ncbi:FAD dependent oxidoreductase [Terfezia boudieri ATCC MYA-4762]|uniref:FAD dependent oxidoreductase n=1 Tax=Terfezia boudieri ATCC MYA-4762 TaxID=1051890 RepID=A0A3N4LH22_9PEZI|nr:FAD dependent oxidoreductase [Terfezia boudieri ATCC MYA-4762]
MVEKKYILVSISRNSLSHTKVHLCYETMSFRRMSNAPSQLPLVIIGAGIIGTSTAYFLTHLNPTREIHILESSPCLFPSSSSRAGGFLAKDWFSSSLTDLGILSFSLHRTLAEKHSGSEKWGYAGSTGLSLITRRTAETLKPTSAAARGESWLRDGASRAEAAASSGSHTPVEPSSSSLVNGTDLSDLPKWLSIASRPQVEVISSSDSTAQIDPVRFCNFLMGGCIAHGVHLHLRTSATRVLTDPDNGNVTAVELNTGITIPCSQVLITAGVWTPTVLRDLFPNINHTCPVLKVSSLAGYSIVYRTPLPPDSADSSRSAPDTPPPTPSKGEKALCHAIFTTTDETASFSPEIFSRHAAHGETEIYLAGLNTASLPFPPLASDIPAPTAEHTSIQRLHNVSRQLLCEGGGGGGGEGGLGLEVVKMQVCHRPVMPDGKPVMGRIPPEELGGVAGVYTCVGHGPWGISLGPGSGLVMAELLEGRARLSAEVGLLSVEHALVAQGSPLGSPAREGIWEGIEVGL